MLHVQLVLARDDGRRRGSQVTPGRLELPLRVCGLVSGYRRPLRLHRYWMHQRWGPGARLRVHRVAVAAAQTVVGQVHVLLWYWQYRVVLCVLWECDPAGHVLVVAWSVRVWARVQVQAMAIVQQLHQCKAGWMSQGMRVLWS